MKVLVTGVGGQLGHDVMNELASRGYEGIGSDIKETYSGIQDGTAVTTMPYVPMDITDAASVEKVLTEAAPDVVVHCAAWTAVDLAEDEVVYPADLGRDDLRPLPGRIPVVSAFVLFFVTHTIGSF